MSKDLVYYQDLLSDIKNRIRQGQYKALISANSEMLATYWDIGKMIHLRQQQEGWGKGVIPRLAVDLKNELAEVKGFSERNIGNMLTFYKEYPDFLILQLPVAKLENDIISPQEVAKSKTAIGQPPVAQLENAEIQQYLITNIGWVQNITLIQKVKDLPTRYWYMLQSINNGWTRDTLVEMIKSNLHKRQGALVNNF